GIGQLILQLLIGPHDIVLNNSFHPGPGKPGTRAPCGSQNHQRGGGNPCSVHDASLVELRSAAAQRPATKSATDTSKLHPSAGAHYHRAPRPRLPVHRRSIIDRKSTRLNSSHVKISYAVFCLNILLSSTSTLFPYTTLFRSHQRGGGNPCSVHDASLVELRSAAAQRPATKSATDTSKLHPSAGAHYHRAPRPRLPVHRRSI